MNIAQTHTVARLERILEERELTTRKYESLMEAIEKRNEPNPTEVESEQLALYRSRLLEIDTEADQLSKDVESANAAAAKAKRIRQTLAGAEPGVELEADGIVYRDFYTYARDLVLSRDLQGCAMLAKKWTDDSDIVAMRERLQLLKRTPANTLSSNVGGLQPPQHIAQILQVIDRSRPLVDSAVRTTLERGTLTYPKVTQRPLVSVQNTQKTEAGNQGMLVGLEQAVASTYLGGGDLSWQAINWSTPDALQLWFDLAAADYALKTEQDAAQAMQHSAFTYNIGSPVSGSPTFAELMTAIGSGYAEVFANSGRTADTVYMAPDRFGYLLGLTSNAFTQFTSVNGSNIGPLSIVVSRGMDSGVIAVGDRSGLLVAETAGAPVELRVVEPAIGGVEVGIIGAFEAVVVDDGAFAMITTAS